MTGKLLAGIVVGVVGAVAVLGGTAGHAQATREWPTYAVADAPESFRPAIHRGDLLIVSLQSALLSELRSGLADGGPSRAIVSCHLDAVAVAQWIARRDGVAAGRTSAKLRNPTNAPRPWAAAIVARYAEARAAGTDGFAVDLGDRIGLLRPIVEQRMCESCHGPLSKIDAAVRARLTELYPVDRATGFREGDIRGWFWLELPKTSEPKR
jgi:hypothetical protein